MKKTETDQALAYILLMGLVLLGVYLFSTFTSVPLNRDAGLYIPLAKDVLHGGTPTVELYTSYTPFAYYAYAFWISLVGTDLSMLVLLMYLVNAASVILFYFIARKFVGPKMMAVALSLIYFFTIMVCQGYLIILEPFQMVFILLAFLAYISGVRAEVKYVLAGLCLGVSFMFKQYSLFVAMGFVITLAMDTFRRSGLKGSREAFFAAGAMIVCATVPFFLFVVLTPADLIGALHSFGFLGGKAASYATAEHVTMATRLTNIIIKVVHLNWLFIPVVIYLAIKLFRPRFVESPHEVVPIFLCSALPIAIRQFGHYFMLIAPWSLLIAGVLLDRLVREPFVKDEDRAPLFRVLVLCALALVAAAVFTPSFHGESKITELVCTGALVGVTTAMLAGWLFMSGQQRNVMGCVLVLLMVLGFESTFLAMKIPFGDLRSRKQEQALEAQRISGVFKKGSEVFVVDYPELYVLCDYANPLFDYTFLYSRNIEKKMGSMEIEKVDNLIIHSQNNFIRTGFFEKNGFRMTHYDAGAELSFYTRAGAL